MKIPKHKMVIILISALIGVALLLIGNTTDNNKKDLKTNYELEDITTYESILEQKLEEAIKKVDGITEAKVILQLDQGSEYIYASDSSENGSKHVIINGSTVFVKKIQPKVRGVAVICSNGNTALINSKVTQIISAALDLSTAKIFVTE